MIYICDFFPKRCSKYSSVAIDFITICWRQPREELVPLERTPWHWSKHVKFRPSWQFHTSPPFIQNSFEQRLQLLCEIHDRKTLMSSVYFFLFPSEGFPRQTCNNHFRRKQGCVLIKFRLLYDNSFAPALGGACAMGTNTMALIQTCQIQAIMTVPERRSSLHSWQTAMSAHVGTEWHILVHVGIQLSPPFIHYFH